MSYWRGQYPASIRHLAGKWGWSIKAVRGFLAMLKNAGIISVENSQGVSIITVKNFDDYVDTAAANEPKKAKNKAKNGGHNLGTPNTLKTNGLQADRAQFGHTSETLNALENNELQRDGAHFGHSTGTVPKDSNNNNIYTSPKGRIYKSFGTAKAVLQSGTAEQPHPPSAAYYERLVEFFNAETRGVFGVIKMPLSATRRGMIAARIREHGEEAFTGAIKRAAQSAFLRGQNSRSWRATFDWIIRPTNFEKIISGNYDNTDTEHHRATKGGAGGIDEDFLRGVAEGIARGSLDGDGRNE